MDFNAKMRRRTFLTAAAAGLSGSALLTGGTAWAVGPANDLGKVTQPLFAPHVGTDVQLQTPDGKTVALKLVAAEELPKGTRKGAKRTAFSLLFRGASKPVLPDGAYNVRHAKLGTFGGLFLVYVGPSKKNDASYYEAIFS